MLITAHGGALNTGRNTRKFFDTVKAYPTDVIEVDIYRRGQFLYISHMPRFFPKRAIPLTFVFEFIKKYGYKVNCDVKRAGLVKPILALAKDLSVADRIIFTGQVTKNDIKDLTDGEVYLNKFFFEGVKPEKRNLGYIKSAIGKLNNERIKGININYRFCDEEMLAQADKIGLKLSIFTVDSEQELERLLKHKELANITTNIIDKALTSAARKI